MQDLRDLVAKYWPEGAGFALVVAFLGKYVAPPVWSALTGAWRIHIGIHERLRKLEEDASELEARLRAAETDREARAVMAATLQGEVRELRVRFEDVRTTMAGDLLALRDESRAMFQRVERVIDSVSDLVTHAMDDHKVVMDALRESRVRPAEEDAERLRLMLREELKRGER